MNNINLVSYIVILLMTLSCNRNHSISHARELIGNQEYARASEILTSLHEKYPDSCEILHLLGIANEEDNGIMSIQYFLESIECDTSLIHYHIDRSDRCFAERNDRDCYIHLKKILFDYFPNYHGVKFRFARFHILQGGNTDSENRRLLLKEEMETCGDTASFYGELLITIGRSFFLDKMYPEAMEYFQQADGHYDAAQVFFWIGLNFYEQENWEKAIENYSLSIAIDSLNSETYYGRSKAYAQSGQTELACLDYAKVIYLDSTYVKGRTDIPCN